MITISIYNYMSMLG